MPDSIQTPEVQRAYDAGRDSAISGANDANCDFRHFATREQTKAWERGRESSLKEVLDAALAKARGETPDAKE